MWGRRAIWGVWEGLRRDGERYMDEGGAGVDWWLGSSVGVGVTIGSVGTTYGG